MNNLWNAATPSEKDWLEAKDNSDLDYNWARKRFLDENLDEAKAILDKNPMSYGEDLGYMPPKVFHYYFRVFVEYLLSEESEGDAGSASTFFRIIKVDLENDGAKAEQIKEYLPELLNKIVSRQTFYGADDYIYGDFKDEELKILQLLD